MYIVKIDGEDFSITEDDLKKFDATFNKSEYHILKDQKAYQANNIVTNEDPKTGSVTLNLHDFHFQILDEYDQLVASMGLDKVVTAKIKDIIAPMPGLILDIMVKPGQVVSEGDSILILEAMKMENVIKAEGDGVVKTVNLSIGDTVDKGMAIIEME